MSTVYSIMLHNGVPREIDMLMPSRLVNFVEIGSMHYKSN